MTERRLSLTDNFGVASHVFRDSKDMLGRLFHRVREQPGPSTKYGEWRHRRSVGSKHTDTSEGLFLTHTYLALLSRLVAFRFLAGHNVPDHQDDLIKVMTGDYFRERDLYNFAEEDFFSWVLHDRVRDDCLTLAAQLLRDLGEVDLSPPGGSPLTAMYAELATPPEISTEHPHEEGVLREKLQEKPGLSVLDPYCGSGSFLTTAIELIQEGLAQRGQDELDALLQITTNVMGMDPDPVAVAVARTSYLLALGDVMRTPHPPVLIPLYVADGSRLPKVIEGDEPLYTVVTSEPGLSFQLPERVAADPDQLDLIFHRMSQYLHAAQFRARTEGEATATDEVMGSVYAYLTSPKRAGLRQLPPLSPSAAEAMSIVARTLIRLTLAGKDGVWLYILKNVPAAVYMSRRKFDLVVGDLPGLPADEAARSRASLGELYLGEGGTNVLTLPNPESTDGQGWTT